jgi:lipopolysaccharide/colanic/teichoic acid biosynthesis glycosyltransferase
MELDVWYVDHRSRWLDAKILAKTAWLLLTGRGLNPG